MDMHNVLSRLLVWMAEILDRNLLMVPEVDEYDRPYTDPTDGRHDREVDRTRPILRELLGARAGKPPGFVQG
jgi:hypothetical protein